MSGDRTEKASPQKKRKAAEKGDRLVSRELIAAAAMLSGAFSLRVTATRWSQAWKETYRSSISLAFTSVRAEISPGELAIICRSIVIHCMTAVLFFGLCSITGALLMGLIQGGGRFAVASIGLNWSRLNPATHIKTIFGMQAFVRLGKSLLPAAVIGSIAVEKILRQRWVPARGFGPIFNLLNSVYDLLLGTAVAMAVWSAIDFVNTWRLRENRLKMTKQDVKEEAKEGEGSPQIKRRIRQIQRQNRKRQIRSDVRKATVLLTNPTHYAVALSFDFVKMEPPKVLAKGQNLIALAMREEAIWAGVPIVENPPLARSLYRSVEPGQSIPFDLYAAVAGILAYLYKKQMEERLRERNDARAASSLVSSAGQKAKQPLA